MSVTLVDFQQYLGTTEEGDFIESALSAGNALVGRLIGDVDTVPNEVHNQAILIAASEIYHRRSAPNGVAQFAAFDGQPVRVAKDPLNAVYPLILPFTGYGV